MERSSWAIPQPSFARSMADSDFSSWPFFDEDEIEAVNKVLRSGRVNLWTGEEGTRFETEFAAYCGASHAIALANGTVALELALEAAGIGPGDEVVVTPRTFIASASCVVRAGAKPVFADVCPDSQNITPESVEAVLTPQTRAVIAVHHAGWPCDMARPTKDGRWEGSGTWRRFRSARTRS